MHHRNLLHLETLRFRRKPSNSFGDSDCFRRSSARSRLPCRAATKIVNELNNKTSGAVSTHISAQLLAEPCGRVGRTNNQPGWRHDSGIVDARGHVLVARGSRRSGARRSIAMKHGPGNTATCGGRPASQLVNSVAFHSIDHFHFCRIFSITVGLAGRHFQGFAQWEEHID